MTTPAAEAITSPTRATGHHGRLGVLPGAQRFAVAEHQEQDVIGADAEQHHDQDRGDGAVSIEVSALLTSLISPVATWETRAITISGSTAMIGLRK